jgi:hypothetical protein
MLPVNPVPAGGGVPGDDDFAPGDFPVAEEEALAAVTCAVSLALGGVGNVVPTRFATAFSVTEWTAVALDLTGSCAWSVVWVLPGAGTLHEAVFFPVPQLVLVKSATCPAGWAESVIVT